MNAQDLPCEIQGDFKILENGDWLHDGVKITRLSLVKLFATILKQDKDGQYWLENPVEKVKIQVEDVPFIITRLEVIDEGDQQKITAITNLEETVILSDKNPLILRSFGKDGMILPYICLSSGLLARCARSVYYQFIDLAVENPDEPDRIGVWSAGIFHILGDLSDN